jgi:hypothetical protein
LKKYQKVKENHEFSGISVVFQEFSGISGIFQDLWGLYSFKGIFRSCR